MNRVLLGMLTPSSNTTLEPVTTAMLAEVPEASAHFGRFAVTEIALKPAGAGAVRRPESPSVRRGLLSHARCQVIAWNGTSAGWLGLRDGRGLCAAIHAETGASPAPRCWR